MKEYFIQLEGKKLGPFSLDDLLRQPLDPDTPIWHRHAAAPVPASEVPELRTLFKKAPPTVPEVAGNVASAIDPSEKGSSSAGTGSSLTSGNRGKIILIVLGILLAGAAVYYFGKNERSEDPKDKISVIHEREVERAKLELKAEKLAKKQAEERALLLQKRKAELRSLQEQLRKVGASRARAISEMDKIRRPHLFRSRAKKEAQLSGQLQIIDRLDAKAISLKNRISRCADAVDSLSAGEPQ